MTDASKSWSPDLAAGWRQRCRRVAAALAVSGLALSRPAAAEPSFERSFEFVLRGGAAPATFRLEPSPPEAARAIRAEDLRSAAEAAHAEAPKPRKFWIGVVSLAAVGGSAYNSFGDVGEEGSRKFHFTSEGWFGRDTYAGGGDKASHFVSFNIVARLLTAVYGELGAPRDGSRLLGAGVSAFAGLVNEIGDGTNRYGFSYEDLIADLLGAATALATAHYGLDDLIGFRAGLVPAPDVVDPAADGFGKDYTLEIYTGDLKISGLAKRLHFRPGPARFLLLSATYGVKGYPYAAPEVRERQIGIEIGLHLSEIARAAGVPDNKWWFRMLYLALDSFRFPYTAVGFQFDVNHKEWRGPGIGDSFPGGGR